MVVAAVVCLCLAVLIGGSGLWTLRRPAPADLTGLVLRAVAPTQVAAGIMLAAAGIVALAAPHRVGLIALVVGVLGAIATVGAGSWQGARYAESRQSAGGCGSGEGRGGRAKVWGSRFRLGLSSG
ncbi:MAG: hypothetical protein KIH64_011910 [Mycobacterium sp.]|nr:hypothetical protein [Mycobacterium sp.]